MEQKKSSLLSIIEENQKNQITECQKLNDDIKQLVSAIIQGEDKERCKDSINTLFDNYSTAMNRLETLCMMECEQHIMCSSNEEEKQFDNEPTSVESIKCVHSSHMSKVLDALSLYSGQGPKCDDCYRQNFSKGESVWHCNGCNLFDLCNKCYQKTCFQCDECDKNLSSKANLDKHKLLHAKSRPFACTKCPCKFVLEERLTAHLINVHNLGRWKCKECAVRYKTKSKLQEHRLVCSNDHDDDYAASDCEYEPNFEPIINTAFRYQTRQQTKLDLEQARRLRNYHFQTRQQTQLDLEQATRLRNHRL